MCVCVMVRVKLGGGGGGGQTNSIYNLKYFKCLMIIAIS